MSNNWTRPELLCALNLYFRTPFGKQHSTHPPIVQLAEKIGRSASAVAMKLSNFTSLDPIEVKRGIKGLSGASKADREIWAEFSGKFESLADESEAALDAFNLKVDDVAPSCFPNEIENTTAVVKIRRRQRFFRKMVLSSYEECCAISQLPIKELLIASHIKPWAVDPQNRLNPQNGICLAATYDKAFDQGFITFNENFELTLSASLKAFASAHGPSSDIESVFERFEGKQIELPQKNLPNPAFMAWHCENIFRN